MKKVWEYVKTFINHEWSMEEKVLVMLCCLLLGIIEGFIWAPLKQGIVIGSNNGNNSGNSGKES